MRAVKILWIDDSENWTLSAQSNLEIISEKYGISFHFFNVPNGEGIVQQCMQYDLDAIVMDYDMTPYSGDKYIQDVRQEEHLESIPILFYSQNNSINLSDLVEGLRNVECVFRVNLEDKIKEIFFKS